MAGVHRPIMRAPALWAAVIAAVLYLPGLGTAPFLDPPEGFHAEIAREMADSGDWVTPRLNGVRYFNKPPLPYWLMGLSFETSGPTPFAARLWSALAGVGTAALTARLGGLLGGPRVGLLAGLMVGANLGFFVWARIVKPDLLLIFFMTLAFVGFAAAYQRGGRGPLAVFYAGLGLSVLAKDLLGGLGPLLVVALFCALTREPGARRWFPWWGLGLAAAIALPWYLAVEARNRGFLWYTLVDVHVLNFAGRRQFPDEDVPLSAVEFLLVSAAAFLPWAVYVPWALARALRWRSAEPSARLTKLLALWAVAVVGLFTLSSFRLPHYALPAFPALALLVARLWADTIDGAPGAVEPRRLLAPGLLLVALAAGIAGAIWAGLVTVPADWLESADVATRNLAAKGQGRGPVTGLFLPLLPALAGVFGIGGVGLAVALRRRSARLGAGVLLATTVAFLLIAGRGLEAFARSRSAQPIAAALARLARPGDVIVHEGPLENSASLLLRLTPPVRVVNGRDSNLAFGATFPEAREVFWDLPRLEQEWGAATVILVSSVSPDRSVVRRLHPIRLMTEAGGRRLYTNAVDRP